MEDEKDISGILATIPCPGLLYYDCVWGSSLDARSKDETIPTSRLGMAARLPWWLPVPTRTVTPVSRCTLQFRSHPPMDRFRSIEALDYDSVGIRNAHAMLIRLVSVLVPQRVVLTPLHPQTVLIPVSTPTRYDTELLC